MSLKHLLKERINLSVLKSLFIGFNIIFLIFGCFIIYQSTKLVYYFQFGLVKLESFHYEILFFVSIGFVIIIICFCSFFGATRRSNILLTIHSFFFILLFHLENVIVLGVASIVRSRQIESPETNRDDEDVLDHEKNLEKFIQRIDWLYYIGAINFFIGLVTSFVGSALIKS